MWFVVWVEPGQAPGFYPDFWKPMCAASAFFRTFAAILKPAGTQRDSAWIFERAFELSI